MKKGIGILTLLLMCQLAYGQTEQKSKVFEVYFEHNDYDIDQSFKGNRETLGELSEFIEKLQGDSKTTISEIAVDGFTSPEGGRSLNAQLAAKRSDAIYNYLTSTLHLPSSVISKSESGVDWNVLLEYVESSDIEGKAQIIEIINSVPEETWEMKSANDKWLTMTDSRNKQLMEVGYGEPYKYMLEEVFPQLRRGTIEAIYTVAPAEVVEDEPVQEVVEVAETQPEPEQPAAPEPVKMAAEPKPMFALKTNLLFDAVSALNVEVEAPIGNRWSIGAEWIFPWWTSCGNKRNSWQSSESKSRDAFQILNGNLEGKYWFGDREALPVMTGWHMGLYVGGGLYDLEHNSKGYQGEFFIATGLSGGYAHTINKSGNLRMEYSLGVGYMQTKYRKYEEHFGIDDKWHTIRQNSGKYSWFGPTRARVSLVWMLNNKASKEE